LADVCRFAGAGRLKGNGLQAAVVAIGVADGVAAFKGAEVPIAAVAAKTAVATTDTAARFRVRIRAVVTSLAVGLRVEAKFLIECSNNGFWCLPGNHQPLGNLSEVPAGPAPNISTALLRGVVKCYGCSFARVQFFRLRAPETEMLDSSIMRLIHRRRPA
jgi:hypothetical protein